MRNRQCETIKKFATDVFKYFQEIKKERELTKEETNLLFSSLNVRQTITKYSLSKMERQDIVRESNREKMKKQLFKLNKIVYEGVVDDIYEPVYASNLKDLKRKMSKCANTLPQEKDFAKVIVYNCGEKSEEQLWTRNNTLQDEKWLFGAWFQV